MTEERPCKLCGSGLFIARDEFDKPIVLDMDAKVWYLSDTAVPAKACYVEHAAVCKKFGTEKQ